MAVLSVMCITSYRLHDYAAMDDAVGTALKLPVLGKNTGLPRIYFRSLL